MPTQLLRVYPTTLAVWDSLGFRVQGFGLLEPSLEVVPRISEFSGYGSVL